MSVFPGKFQGAESASLPADIYTSVQQTRPAGASSWLSLQVRSTQVPPVCQSGMDVDDKASENEEEQEQMQDDDLLSSASSVSRSATPEDLVIST